MDGWHVVVSVVYRIAKTCIVVVSALTVLATGASADWRYVTVSLPPSDLSTSPPNVRIQLGSIEGAQKAGVSNTLWAINYSGWAQRDYLRPWDADSLPVSGWSRLDVHFVRGWMTNRWGNRYQTTWLELVDPTVGYSRWTWLWQFGKQGPPTGEYIVFQVSPLCDTPPTASLEQLSSPLENQTYSPNPVRFEGTVRSTRRIESICLRVAGTTTRLTMFPTTKLSSDLYAFAGNLLLRHESNYVDLVAFDVCGKVAMLRSGMRFYVGQPMQAAEARVQNTQTSGNQVPDGGG